MTRLLFAFIFLLAGCARHPQETGFLTSYTNLQPVSSTCLRYVAPNDILNQYNRYIIEPVTVKFYDPSDEHKVKPQDIKHLKDYLSQAIEKEFSAKYQITTQAGPGVAILRVAITDLQPSTPALNVLPQAQLLGLGLGQVSVEAELLDSQNHTQLAAIVESEQVQRFSLSDLSDWGGIEAIMDTWAKQLRTRIDDAHNQ